MKLWTKASLGSALLVTGLLMPKALACGGGGSPPTIIPFAVLIAWPAIAASLAGSLPICLWHEGRARKRLVNMLRDGVCIKDSKHIMRWARLRSALLVVGLAAASPFVFFWTVGNLNQYVPHLGNELFGVYYTLAMTPEEFVSRWWPDGPRSMRSDILY